MEEYRNYPINVLAAFSPTGEVIPRFFRLETLSHEQITLKVLRVITSEIETFCGLHRIHFFCEVSENDHNPFFCEIYFNKESSKWVYGKRCLSEASVAVSPIKYTISTM